MYTATVLNFISISSSVKELFRLQDICTDRETRWFLYTAQNSLWWNNKVKIVQNETAYLYSKDDTKQRNSLPVQQKWYQTMKQPTCTAKMIPNNETVYLYSKDDIKQWNSLPVQQRWYQTMNCPPAVEGWTIHW